MSAGDPAPHRPSSQPAPGHAGRESQYAARAVSYTHLTRLPSSSEPTARSVLVFPVPANARTAKVSPCLAAVMTSRCSSVNSKLVEDKIVTLARFRRHAADAQFPGSETSLRTVNARDAAVCLAAWRKLDRFTGCGDPSPGHVPPRAAGHSDVPYGSGRAWLWALYARISNRQS